jgi:hypothetical protein
MTVAAFPDGPDLMQFASLPALFIAAAIEKVTVRLACPPDTDVI